MNLNSFLLVGTGGAIGSMLRYGASFLTSNRSFPLITFAVNVTGSFFIGLLAGLLLKNNLPNYSWKFFASGICGGFTTFSAFSLEGLELLQQQRYFIFALYVLLSISAGIGAAYAGFFFTR